MTNYSPDMDSLESRMIECPVCGEIVYRYDLCTNCNWENTGLINIDGGPNYMTLEEAKKAWAEGRPVR